MRILVLAPYPEGTAPSQRFRFEQCAGRLRGAGLELEVSTFLDRDVLDVLYQHGSTGAKTVAVLRGLGRRLRDLRRAGAFDAVLVHRQAALIGYPFVEWALSLQEVPYVFDFDDSIYLRRASEANRWVAALKPAGAIAGVARRAALVVAGNSTLAEWASRMNDRVTVIPTTIDTAAYVPRIQAAKPDTSLCIGWSGSVTTAPYLDRLAPVLREIQQRRGVRLRVIGDPTYTIPGARIEALPWRERTEVQDLQQIDIGVMPLPDDEWTRGKCGLKALQYMALGIPCVMSPVGVNSAIAAGGAAWLASTRAEWHDSLEALLDDPQAREELARRGRARVVEQYSTDVAAPLWAETLLSVARSRRAG